MKQVIEKLAGCQTFDVANQASSLFCEGKKKEALELITAEEDDINYLIKLFSEQLNNLRQQALKAQSSADQAHTIEGYTDLMMKDFERFPELLTGFLVAVKNANQ